MSEKHDEIGGIVIFKPKSDNPNRYGKKLQQLRIENEMTLLDVASELVISTSYLEDVESGKAGPFSIENNVILAELFNVDKRMLFCLAAISLNQPCHVCLTHSEYQTFLKSKIFPSFEPPTDWAKIRRDMINWRKQTEKQRKTQNEK